MRRWGQQERVWPLCVRTEGCLCPPVRRGFLEPTPPHSSRVPQRQWRLITGPGPPQPPNPQTQANGEEQCVQ